MSDPIRAGGAFVEFSADFKKLQNDLRAGNPVLDRLKKSFGESSGLGGWAKAITGAGATAGLAVAGNALADMTGKLRELHDELAAGKIGWGEYVEEIAKSVPVLGNFWEAGRNIRELITGEIGRTKANEAAEKSLTAAREAHIRVLQAGEKALRDYARSGMRGFRETQAAQAGTDQERRDIEALSKFEQSVGAERDKRNAALAAVGTQIEELAARLGGARFEMTNKKGTSITQDLARKEAAQIEKTLAEAKSRRQDIMAASQQEEQRLQDNYNRELLKSNEQAMQDAHEQLAEVDRTQREIREQTTQSVMEFNDGLADMVGEAAAQVIGDSEATVSNFSRGTSDAAALQSLQGGFAAQVPSDVKIIREFTTFMRNKIESGELSGTVVP